MATAELVRLREVHGAQLAIVSNSLGDIKTDPNLVQNPGYN